MWFFNEDEYGGKQGLQLSTTNKFRAKNTCKN